ncbi:hypothetical protein [Pseudomonas syringae]|uniref:hypothetical protein n=1 Tax=Pseudomonas syringae TaxID=317 RepID=UPI000FFED5E1|nr:hypothetical protein [Pseudomonas syringae]MCK9776377.1 hypothetical protein [Pseudomonas syringae pv. syringae]RXF65447.1 hypothetical protein BKM77_04150 [Pseudomonas syringae]
MVSGDITVVVSIVGGVVGLIAMTVAYSQMRIASSKTKLDLYNKRFDVYTAALDYHKAAWHGDCDVINEAGEIAVRYFRESQFLFDPDDKIFPLLQRFMQAGAFVRRHAELEKEVGLGNQTVDELYKASQEKSTSSLVELGDILQEFEVKLARYLSFHSVKGWTFF